MYEEHSIPEAINVTEGEELDDASRHLTTELLDQEPTPPDPGPITLPPGPIGTSDDPEPPPPDNESITKGD